MNPDDENWFRRKIEEAVFAAVQALLDADQAAERADAVRRKHPRMPKDALAHILIDRATRKTMVEGALSGAAITVAEIPLAAPVPEPGQKALAISGISALIVGDIGFTTKVQMQLLLEIGELYECPFSKDDEDDVWLIFKAALGAKGTERIGGYGRFVFDQTARKQFRRLLRTHGIRRTAQKIVQKVAGKEVAKRISEKALMRLIWAANIFLGAWFNRRATKAIGKWAKVKAKVRASFFTEIDSIKANDRASAVLALPLVFWVGTADDTLVDNTITLYAQATRRLSLTPEELEVVEKLVDREDLAEAIELRLRNVPELVRREFLAISVTSAAAARLEIVEAQHQALITISQALGQTYARKDLEEKIGYLTR